MTTESFKTSRNEVFTVAVADDLRQFDLSSEEWREYDFGGRVYRIDKPRTLYIRPGGITHRVVCTAGITHCVPSPGENGCVVRWKATPPVSF